MTFVPPLDDDADMVIVNTCGFIDSAVQVAGKPWRSAEQLDQVIVTGCTGAKSRIREVRRRR